MQRQASVPEFKGMSISEKYYQQLSVANPTQPPAELQQIAANLIDAAILLESALSAQNAAIILQYLRQVAYLTLSNDIENEVRRMVHAIADFLVPQFLRKDDPAAYALKMSEVVLSAAEQRNMLADLRLILMLPEGGDVTFECIVRNYHFNLRQYHFTKANFAECYTAHQQFLTHFPAQHHSMLNQDCATVFRAVSKKLHEYHKADTAEAVTALADRIQPKKAAKKKRQRRKKELRAKQVTTAATSVMSAVLPADEKESPTFPLSAVFSVAQQQLLQKIFAQLATFGSRNYLVGGVLLNLLLQTTAKNVPQKIDIDIVTGASSAQLAAQLSPDWSKNSFNTNLLSYQEGTMNIDIYCSEPLADQKLTDESALLKDAQNRDVTTGTFYARYAEKLVLFTPIASAWGDMQSKIIDTVQPAADTFLVNPIRILRVIYRANKLGFKLADAVKEASQKHARLLWDNPQHTNSWLLKMFSQGQEQAIANLNMLIELGIFAVLFPNVQFTATHTPERLIAQVKIAFLPSKPSLRDIYDQFLFFAAPADHSGDYSIQIAANPLYVAAFSWRKKPISFSLAANSNILLAPAGIGAASSGLDPAPSAAAALAQS